MRISDWSSDVCSSDLSLTVASGGEDNVLDRIAPRAVPKDWWTRISDLSPLSHSIAKQVTVTGGLIIVALPKSYLEMISDELAHLPKSARTRLRILTGAPAARVDPRLHPWLMPYDDRRSEEHTSELQSLMRISYAVFCLKNKK